MLPQFELTSMLTRDTLQAGPFLQLQSTIADPAPYALGQAQEILLPEELSMLFDHCNTVLNPLTTALCKL